MTLIRQLTRVSDLPSSTKAARFTFASFCAKTAERGPVLGKSLASSAAKHARFRDSAGQSAAISDYASLPGLAEQIKCLGLSRSTALAALRSCFESWLYAVLGFTK